MAAPTRPPRNSFNAAARKIYNPLGFSKAYNFILWFIFAGALFGFVLARFMFLNFSANFCPQSGPGKGGSSAAPGECYYYETFTRYKVGIIMHLAGVLPSGLLAVIQFTPFIRHRWTIVHRVNGYVALFLYAVGTAGALMILRHAFGGGIEVQVVGGLLSIMSVVSFVLAIANIKRLQIEQHRAWMLRGWFYAGSIITSRLILFISSLIISGDSYYTVWSCAKIEFTLKDASTLLDLYPGCSAYANGTDPNQVAIVQANLGGSGSNAVTSGGALNVTFGMALWLAFAMHAIGVEVYLQLTPKEAQRLRQVSYQRQLEAGMKNPGSAGLTSNRLGDANVWVSAEKQRTESQESIFKQESDSPDTK